MVLQLPGSPTVPPPPVLTCAGCHRVCDPRDDLHTSDAVYAVCADCWEAATAPDDPAYRAWLRQRGGDLERRLSKSSKNDYLAALERRVLDEE